MTHRCRTGVSCRAATTPLWQLNKNYRIDVLVENSIIVEIKSISDIYPIDEAQLVSYMKLAGIKLGYLINFNEVLLKDGIRRRVNNYFR